MGKRDESDSGVLDLLAKRLRDLRGMDSLSKISNGSDVATSTISQYENSERDARITILIKLARYYNVSLSYLTGQSDERGVFDGKD